MRKSSFFKKVITAVCITTITFSGITLGMGANEKAFAENTNETEINKINEIIQNAINARKEYEEIGEGESLLASEGFLDAPCSTGTNWMAMAIGRWGHIEGADYKLYEDSTEGANAYLEALEKYVEEAYASNGTLSTNKATEFHKAILAIAALGGDPTSFGQYNGQPINLVADGTYNNPNPGRQGINAWVYGLLAMDVKSYEVPDDAAFNRDTFIKNILMNQLASTKNPGQNGETNYGGWTFWGSNADADLTGMAIQALAPYYNDDTIYSYTNSKTGEEITATVKDMVDMAINELGQMQMDDGGYSSWGTANVESTAQVVTALTALKINPMTDERFVKNGNTLLDGIMLFATDNGGFAHTISASGNNFNSMANDQIVYSLVSYYRYLTGMNTLFNMSGEKIDINEDDSNNANEGGNQNGQTGNNNNSGQNAGQNSSNQNQNGEILLNGKDPSASAVPKTEDTTSFFVAAVAMMAAVVFLTARKKTQINEKNK